MKHVSVTKIINTFQQHCMFKIHLPRSHLKLYMLLETVNNFNFLSCLSLSPCTHVASNLSHYFSPTSLTNSPARALLLVAAVLLAYWFLSMFLGGFFYLLHAVFGRFFWLARVTLFALSCLYILQKFEGDPERAVLPLCFIMAVYFMTGPVGAYWRRGGGAGSLEEKIDHLDTQIRLLNIRLSRVIDTIERTGDQ